MVNKRSSSNIAKALHSLKQVSNFEIGILCSHFIILSQRQLPSLLLSWDHLISHPRPIIKANFLANPYLSYHAANSKEFIELSKASLIHFKPNKQLELLPSNTDAFPAVLEASSKRFSYNGILKRIATTRTVDSDDGTNTFGDFRDLLESWNQISLSLVLQNSNQTWGDKTWTDVFSPFHRRPLKHSPDSEDAPKGSN